MSEALVEQPSRRAGPGRPPSGARERIVAAAFEVLKQDGYAGLTTAKVAAEAGHNKALIGYHFGGKQGLVAEVARLVAEEIVAEVLETTADADSISALARSILDAVWRVMERDEGVQRVYFDLASQSVVDPEVEAIMAEVKARFRAILRERIRAVSAIRGEARIEAAVVYLIAGVEGLALERLDRGETPGLAEARRLWAASVGVALDA